MGVPGHICHVVARRATCASCMCSEALLSQQCGAYIGLAVDEKQEQERALYGARGWCVRSLRGLKDTKGDGVGG